MLRSHLIAAALILVAFPSVAFAQGDEIVDCSDDDNLFVVRNKYKLYNPDCLRDQASRSRDARDAYKAGDLYEAVKIYESLLQVRPLNVYHLSLGRAYQRLNMCIEAREQFEMANDSREGIDVPNPPDVPKIVTRYRKQLKEQDTCFGRVELQCDPIGMTLDYDTLEYIKDPKSGEWGWKERRVEGDICAKDTVLNLPPGEQKITATYAGETEEFTLTSASMIQTIFPITIQPKDPVIKDPVAGDPVRDGLNPKDPKTGDTQVDVTVNIDNNKHKPNPALGWTLVGAGAAVLVGGLLYDTCLFQQPGLNQQIEDAISNNTFSSQPGQNTFRPEGVAMCESVTYSQVTGAGGPLSGSGECSCLGRVDRRFDFSDAIGPLAYLAGSLLAINGVIRF